MKEYIEQYEKIWHQVVKVYVGFPFAHDTFCQARLQWRVLRLRADMNEWSDMAAVLDAYAKVADTFFQTYMVRERWSPHVRVPRPPLTAWSCA